MFGRQKRTAIVPAELNFLAPVALDDMVRVGRQGDGGYVLSEKTASAISTVLSFGISEDWSFEADLFRRNRGVMVHAYDHTISHDIFISRWRAWLDRAARGRISLKSLWHRYSLPHRYAAFFRGAVKHYEERVATARERPNDATIDQIFDRAAGHGNLFVKMDIEGAEYDVIPHILRRSSDVVGLAVEFHEIGARRDAFIQAVSGLAQRFAITHLHANNYAGQAADGFPDAVEITFERPAGATRRRNRLPIALDQPNKKSRPDYELVFQGLPGGA